MDGGAGDGLATYRAVLRLPGLAPLAAVGFAARLPVTATSVVLTLHVAVGQGAGFAAAGVVGGAVTAGVALGAPLLGRVIDRRGLRPVLVVCGAAQAGFWGVAPLLDVGVLAPAALAAGLLTPPAFPVVRQSLAASVPAGHQRPAFALDAMSTEVAYAVGPALGTAALLGLLALGSLPVALGGPWWSVTLLLVPAGACCAPALAAAAEAVGRLAPDAARGVATGLHGSALMAGATVAAPLAGVLIDAAAPAAAVVAAVALTGTVALVAGLASRTRS
jgi:MFS family permease